MLSIHVCIILYDVCMHACLAYSYIHAIIHAYIDNEHSKQASD